MDESQRRNQPYAPYAAMMALFALVLAGTVYVLRRPEPSDVTIITPTPRPTQTLALVVVDLRGAIAKPGVYTVSPGSRVQDVLELAGGVLANAETRGLNLARRLVDGEQIYVPVQGEATRPVSTDAPARGRTSSPSAKVNINTASLEQLDALPGIGPALAQRIVDYRTQNAPFEKPEDLKKVRGIGDVLFSQVQDLITVE